MANNNGNKINTNPKEPSLNFYKKKAKPPFARQAAAASLAIPLILVFFQAILRDSVRGAPGVLIMSGVLMLVTGVGLGVIALITRKTGTRGIVVKATIGLIINSVLLVLFINGFIIGYQKGKQEVVEKQRVTYEKKGMDSVLNYPGWIGGGTYGAARLGAVSVNDKSEASRFFNNNCKKEVSVMNLTVINPPGQSYITLDISFADIILRDNTKIRSLPLDEVLRSMKQDQDKLMKSFLGPHKIAPGTSFSTGDICVPRGFDWSKVDTVIVGVDGREVEISGRMYTAKEKQQLYQLGLKNK